LPDFSPDFTQHGKIFQITTKCGYKKLQIDTKLQKGHVIYQKFPIQGLPKYTNIKT
jgi:hypothetical protein